MIVIILNIGVICIVVGKKMLCLFFFDYVKIYEFLIGDNDDVMYEIDDLL